MGLMDHLTGSWTEGDPRVLRFALHFREVFGVCSGYGWLVESLALKGDIHMAGRHAFWRLHS